MKSKIILFFLWAFPFYGYNQIDFFKYSFDANLVHAYQVQPLRVDSPLKQYFDKKRHLPGISLSGNVQFTKNWGASVQLTAISGLFLQEESFEDFLYDYYLPSTYAYKPYMESYSPKGDEIQTISVGGFYQLSFGNWAYHFGLGFGAAKWNIPTLKYYTKEHGTNLYFKSEFETFSNRMWSFSLQPDFSISYTLSRKVDLMLGVSYNIYFMKYTVRHITTHLYTEEVFQNTSYKKGQPNILSAKLGVRIGLGRKVEQFWE